MAFRLCRRGFISRCCATVSSPKIAPRGPSQPSPPPLCALMGNIRDMGTRLWGWTSLDVTIALSLSLSLSVFICKCPNINSTNACKHEYVQIHVYHLIIIYTSTLPVALLTILLAPLQKFQVYTRKFGIMGHATVSNAPASCPSTATP